MPSEDAGPVRLADCRALLLMMRYVETECRRLGMPAAAAHVALAAALMAGEGSVPPAHLPARQAH